MPGAAIAGLADVLARENAALADMDLPRAAALLTEKAAAMARLPAVDMDGLAPGLGPAVERLNALAQENRRLLERGMVAQERVIGIVARAVADAMALPAYGARGRAASCATGPLALSTRV